MIRRATKGDLTSINKLGMLITDNFLTSINDFESKVKEIYVYEEKKVLAFLIINNFKEEIEIIDIAVKKEYQNKNIASKLLLHLLNMYNKKCFLEVNVNNLNAIKLYEKYDFKVIDIRKNYYDNKDDALIMMRDVK